MPAQPKKTRPGHGSQPRRTSLPTIWASAPELFVFALAILPHCQLWAKACDALQRVVPKRRPQAEQRHRDQEARHFVQGLRPASPVLEKLELRARKAALERSRLVNQARGIAS